MTFVFEAHELPFNAVTDEFARKINDLITAYDLGHLPLWDRCMLAAVLPVVLQRRQGMTAAEQPDDEVRASAHDGGDVADAAADVPSAPSASPPSLSPGGSSISATLSDLEVALAIVHQLDELETVYDTIVSARQARQTTAEEEKKKAPASRSQGAWGAAAAAAPRQAKTSEELLMEQLLQERFSETAPYLPESGDGDGDDDDDKESGEPASQDRDAVMMVDVAMCFTANGESLGIGSSSVFGGQGYHPEFHPCVCVCVSMEWKPQSLGDVVVLTAR